MSDNLTISPRHAPTNFDTWSLGDRVEFCAFAMDDNHENLDVQWEYSEGSIIAGATSVSFSQGWMESNATINLGQNPGVFPGVIHVSDGTNVTSKSFLVRVQ